MKKTIKYSVFLLLLLITTHSTYAQKIYIETGLSTAFFKDYKNDLGENTLDLSYSKPTKPFLEAGCKFNIYKERAEWDLGVNYSSYKINTAFSSGNIKIPITYDLGYVALKTGVNVSVIHWKNIKLQLHSHLSYDWLTYGTYSYENKTVDIYKEKTLDRTLFRYHRGISMEYFISNEISTNLIYNIADSFKEKNKDSSQGEEYVFRTKSISLGLVFKIKENADLKKQVTESKK